MNPRKLIICTVLLTQVVENLIKHSNSESLVPIALTCSQFMEESNLSTISKESEHNHKEETEEEDKVHIPGAHYLMVEFDSRLVYTSRLRAYRAM